MIKKYADFTNISSKTVTIQDKLIPMWETAKNIEANMVIDDAEETETIVNAVKKLADGYYRDYIQASLAHLSFAPDSLAYYYRFVNGDITSPIEEITVDSNKKKIDHKAILVKNIVSNFDVPKNGGALIKLLKDCYKNDKAAKDVLADINGHSGYIDSFVKNREFIFSSDYKIGSIAYRLLEQNFPKYCLNITIYNELKSHDGVSEKIKELESELGYSVGDYFVPENYAMVATQAGIDKYNTIIGGFTTSDNKKIKGLNELGNEYNQTLKDNSGKTGKKIRKMLPLFKQILETASTTSFVIEKFTSDSEVFNAIDCAYDSFVEAVLNPNTGLPIDVFCKRLSRYNMSHVYVKANGISSISMGLYSDWSKIDNALSEYYDIEHPRGSKKTLEKYNKEKEKHFKNVKKYSIEYLNKVSEAIIGDNYIPVESYFYDKVVETLAKIETPLRIYKAIDRDKYLDGKSIKTNDNDKGIIKKFLDSLCNVRRVMAPLYATTDSKDADGDFFNEFDRIYTVLRDINTLYNRVRAYVTGKIFIQNSVRVDFGYQNLLDGFAKSKEETNHNIIFKNGNSFYLGIYVGPAGVYKQLEKELSESTNRDGWQRFVYNQIPNAAKTITGSCFADGNIEKWKKAGAPCPPDFVVAAYKREKKKNDEDKEYKRQYTDEELRGMIEWYCEYFNNAESYQEICHCKLNPDEYKTIKDVCNAIEEKCGYRTWFDDIDGEVIRKFVKNGQMYLFQIYNRNFSDDNNCIDTIYTLLLREVLQDADSSSLFRLRGASKITYRPAADIDPEDIIVHKAGVPIPNKNPLNPRKFAIYPYDIIKNKRFLTPQFTIHMTIGINPNKKIATKDLNYKIWELIRNSDKYYVLGIDRGERNLIYVTLINQDGEIVKEESWNIIDDGRNKFDYHRKLEDAKKHNIIAADGWGNIEKTKEIKDGYMSAVLGEIVKMIDNLDAPMIIAAEKLDTAFINKRRGIENQVYEQFGKALMNKLQYIVNRKKGVDELGGFHYGVQLANAYNSLDTAQMWQNGILFFVPAAYTSKIDPMTGFASRFKTKYVNMDTSRKLISSFDRIYFSNADNMYAFDFDYRNFGVTDDYRNTWTVWTNGSRTKYNRSEKKVRWINLTNEWNRLFADYGINTAVYDLRDQMVEVKDADFYKRFNDLFYAVVQMRNSDDSLNIDEIISPVKNADGMFFVSGQFAGCPKTADGNGSYNIAKKAAWALKNIIDADFSEGVNMKNVKTSITSAEWFEYNQKNPVATATMISA